MERADLTSHVKDLEDSNDTVDALYHSLDASFRQLEKENERLVGQIDEARNRYKELRAATYQHAQPGIRIKLHPYFNTVEGRENDSRLWADTVTAAGSRYRGWPTIYILLSHPSKYITMDLVRPLFEPYVLPPKYKGDSAAAIHETIVYWSQEEPKVLLNVKEEYRADVQKGQENLLESLETLRAQFEGLKNGAVARLLTPPN